jgi:hypothetical protein
MMLMHTIGGSMSMLGAVGVIVRITVAVAVAVAAV